MRVTLDTNVLVSAFSRRERHHRAAASLLARVALGDCIQPMQTFGEFFSVVTRKYRLPPAEAIAAIDQFRTIVGTTTAAEPDFDRAMHLVSRYRAQFWDALMWATASRVGTNAVLTDDVPGIANLDGMTFVNPFEPDSERELRLLLPLAET